MTTKSLKVMLGDDGRVFFVGDIHGEITKLNEKLEEVGFDKERDSLFSVGDLIDRGEDSLACLELIHEPWFYCVRGNHEELMVESLLRKSQNHIMCWLQNGGNWYFELSDEDRMYVKDLAEKIDSEVPYVIELHHRGRKIVMCHADHPSDEYAGTLEDEELFNVVWSRDRINTFMKKGTEEVIEGADLFVFGHTPVKTPTHVGNCIYIDTGAVYGGGRELTLMEDVIDEYKNLQKP